MFSYGAAEIVIVFKFTFLFSLGIVIFCLTCKISILNRCFFYVFILHSINIRLPSSKVTPYEDLSKRWGILTVVFLFYPFC